MKQGRNLFSHTVTLAGDPNATSGGQQELSVQIAIDFTGSDAPLQLPAINIAVVPDAPTDLAVTTASSTEIDLAWTDQSSIATQDVIYESTDDGSDFEPIDEVTANGPGAANSYQATGLNPGSEYQFYVTAAADDAESTPVLVAVQNTTFVPPTLDVEGSGTVVEGQPYELDLTAEYPDGEPGSIDHWTVDWNDGPGGSSNPITYTYPAGADPTQPLVVTHTFAAGIDSPNVTATAVDLANGSFTADPQQVAVIPMATGPLTATVSMGTTVNLAWTNTSSISAGTIVFESTDGTNFDPLYEVDPGVATYSVTGLSPATQYWFEVETDSVNGQSDPSNITPVATDYPPSTLSVAQQGQAIENQLTLNVQWTATDGAPSTEGISYWLIDWGDGFGQQAYDTQGSGVVQPITRAFSTGQYGAHVTVSAVDGSSPSRTYPALDQEYYLAPQAPTYITANYANSDTELNVRWQDASQIASDYLVQRVKAGLEGGTWATKATIDAHASADYLSIIDVAPEINQSDWGYVYRVVAEAPAGDQNRDSALGEAVVPIPGDNDGSRIVFYNSEGISSDLSGSIGIGSTWSTYIGEMTEIPIQVLDSSGDPEANVTVTVAGFDPTIIQVLDMTDETDSNGQAWVPVEGVGTGTSPLAIADPGGSEAVTTITSTVDPAPSVPYSVAFGGSELLNGLAGIVNNLFIINPIINAANAAAAALDDISGTVTDTITDQTFTYPDPQHFQYIPSLGSSPVQILFDPIHIPVSGTTDLPNDPYPKNPQPVLIITSIISSVPNVLTLTAIDVNNASAIATSSSDEAPADLYTGVQVDGTATLLLAAGDTYDDPGDEIDWNVFGGGYVSKSSGDFGGGAETLTLIPGDSAGQNEFVITATEGNLVAIVDVHLLGLTAWTEAPGNTVGTTALDRKNQETIGAFVPWDTLDQDYDGTPDYKETTATPAKAVVGDNLMMKITLQGVGAGNYTLVLPANGSIAVFNSPDGTGGPITQPVSAVNDTDLYVEGAKFLGNNNECILSVDWTDGKQSVKGAGALKITIFKFVGSQDVPGNASYIYTVSGLKKAVGWTSVGPNPMDSLTNGKNTSTATVKWSSGPEFGEVVYTVNPSYIWQFMVNVVQINLDLSAANSPLTYKLPPTQDPNFPNLVQVQSQPKGSLAMSAQVKVTSIVGPTDASGQMRGVKWIELGFIQTETTTQQNATFTGVAANGAPLTATRTDFVRQDGKIHTDGDPLGLYPWYDFKSVNAAPPTKAILSALTDQQASQPQYISTGDTPDLVASDTLQKNYKNRPFTLVSVALHVNFTVYVAVATTKPDDPIKAATPGGKTPTDGVFTSLGSATWQFDGSGTVTKGVWARGASAVTNGQNSFSATSSGTPVPLPGGSTFANDLLTGWNWN